MEGKLKEFKTRGDSRNAELQAEHDAEIAKLRDEHKEATRTQGRNAQGLEDEIALLKVEQQNKLAEIESL